jgi:hypothetical protein
MATTNPYFKTYGADVFTGGWVNSGQNSCNPASADYQAPDYVNGSVLHRGGIMAFNLASTSRIAGASSEFGAASLGFIEGSSGSSDTHGFSTGTGTKNELSFANTKSNSSNLDLSSYWGGFIEGNTRQTHCFPDYYTTKQNSPSTVANLNDVSSFSGQKKISSSSVITMQSSGNIAGGKNITVFVDGNVYIDSNITYEARSYYTADTAPKFALVVKGSIYVSKNVTELDGLYIAQPDPDVNDITTADTGVIWTCHGSSTTVPTGSFVSQNCRNKLSVEGALVAKQVVLLRAIGDVASATVNESKSSANIAETVNFIPEMITGGAFFDDDGSTSDIESIINLPPIF